MGKKINLADGTDPVFRQEAEEGSGSICPSLRSLSLLNQFFQT
jgi:hypothetical protein